MVPSEDPEYIMYVTVQEPKTWNNNFFATVVNPVLEEAMSMGATLDTSVSEGVERLKRLATKLVISLVRHQERQLILFAKT